MEIEKLLTYFDKVTRLSDGKYKAICPCHSDHEPSLYITKGNKGIIIKCHVCGVNGKAVADNLGIDINELFYDTKKSKHNTYSNKEVIYNYGDTLRKKRYYKDGKKHFYWQHKDENGKWQNGKGKDENGFENEVPLYNESIFDELNNGDTVYIVEGEKDVETMKTKFGLPAVSSPHGASRNGFEKKWLSTYNNLFKGFSVVIMPDNDTAGKNFAVYIASQIVNKAETVKIIDLSNKFPNVNEKDDITDVFEREYSKVGESACESVKKMILELSSETENFAVRKAKHKSVDVPLWVKNGNDGLVLDEPVYVQEFVKTHGYKCIGNVLYSVDGKTSDDKVKQIIIKDILDYVKTNHGDKAEKLLKSIKQLSYSDPMKLSIEKIHFKNGTLSQDENKQYTVWTTEKEFCINRIPVEYNPKAENPSKFFKYLNDVYFEDDIKTLQQFCGYCLIPTTHLQKALTIIGNGGEGKSVLGNILNVIIGKENCYNDSVSTLSDKFGLSNLQNILLFIDDDLSEKALNNASAFKKVITNKNPISAEKKYVQKNEFESYARFMMFGNFTLQALYDTSEGFFRRQVVLRAKDKDINRIDNPFIDEEIINEESSGVLNWLLEGLNELMQNNFTLFLSERSKAESERLKRESDTVALFLDESNGIEFGDDYSVSTKILYDSYVNYCNVNGLFAVQMKTFTNSLKAKERQYKIMYSNHIKSESGKCCRGFTGIRTRSNYHTDWD